MRNSIELKNIRVNNLKNISLDIMKNKTFKTWFNNNVIEKNISFETVKKTYTKYFGSVLPFEKLMKTEPVFNEKLNYTELNKFENGISLTVENNYLVPVQYSGIVVFVGEKKPYGNTVIIESDNVTIWYSNIDTSNIKVYDHVEKGKYLGETLNNARIIKQYSEKDKGYKYFVAITFTKLKGKKA